MSLFKLDKKKISFPISSENYYCYYFFLTCLTFYLSCFFKNFFQSHHEIFFFCVPNVLHIFAQFVWIMYKLVWPFAAFRDIILHYIHISSNDIIQVKKLK